MVNAVPVANGGTGASNVSGAVSNLSASIYPIGSIYINAGVTTNPGTLLGFGTWTAFGAGRVMVGLNNSDTAFDTLQETGGSKDSIVVSHTHTATVTDSGHSHNIPISNDFGYPSGSGGARQGSGATTSSATTGITVANSTTGSSGTNANLQPYITVCMWLRTA